MKLITAAIGKALLANGQKAAKDPSFDTKPVLKLFGGGACTWLIGWIDPENQDRAYGLCDLGHGYPELGYVSLRELMAIRFRPFGLGVERDRWFTASKTLGEYAKEARNAGRIVA